MNVLSTPLGLALTIAVILVGCWLLYQLGVTVLGLATVTRQSAARRSGIAPYRSAGVGAYERPAGPARPAPSTPARVTERAH